MSIETNTTVRWAAAALVLAGGIVHFKLWNDGYKDYPNDNLGRMFMLNVVSSVIAAIALAVWDHWLPVVGALGVVNGTLFAFGLSRTDAGVPFTSIAGTNFAEKGFEPSPEALLALVFEIGAAAALVYVLYGLSTTMRSSVISRIE